MLSGKTEGRQEAMTRFVCITDSHWGVEKSVFNDVNYHVQEGYPERAEEIIDALASYIKAEKIDFVIHCGDIINAASAELIKKALEMFSCLPVPMYLCLGNHDVADPEAKDWWLQYAPGFFPERELNFTLNCDDCSIHIVPNQWGEGVYEWISDQTASLLPQQKEFLEDALSRDTDRLHFIVTHSQVHAIDAAQVGPFMARHCPDGAFTAYFAGLTKQHPHLRAVIAGHTHHNMYVLHENCHYVTTSSLLEAPFDCKVFTIDGKHIDMHTHSLGHDVDFAYKYDYDRTHSQGRLWDRTFDEQDGEFMRKPECPDLSNR